MSERPGARGFPLPERIKRAVLGAIRAAGYNLVRLPVISPLVSQGAGGAALVGVSRRPAIDPKDDLLSAESQSSTVDRFAEVDELLNLITPWSGEVPNGYVVDFLGILRDGNFLWNHVGPCGGQHVSTSLPTVATDGEGWFEVADWLMSAHEAREQYVAVSLGACFGHQLVGAWKALQAINPLPSRLVAVEPVPQNCIWIRSHMATNGINPDDHWIIPAALGNDNEPILFPVGAPGAGLNSSLWVNSTESRQSYAHALRILGYSERVLENILLYNSTGVLRELGHGYSGELKFVSALTLRDVLSPFDRVDLLEVDIQQSEIEVIPPYMELVNRKVRRVHVGTHGREAHDLLRTLFSRAKWDIVFDYAPDSHHVTKRGSMDLGDGILTARNPAV
jgi:FkbM family methyltransferase